MHWLLELRYHLYWHKQVQTSVKFDKNCNSGDSPTTPIEYYLPVVTLVCLTIIIITHITANSTYS